MSEAATYLLEIDANGVPQKDIWAIAGTLLEAHGMLAIIETSKIADRCLERGEMNEQIFWQRVIRAIATMTEPLNEGWKN